MKTWSEFKYEWGIVATEDSFIAINKDQYKAIQLDAYKAGMLRAAEVINKLDCGNPECGSIVCDTNRLFRSRILTAANNLKELP